MSYKTVAASLILAVLPAAAAAQSATQPAPATPPNARPQMLSPATQAAIGRSRAASGYYPPVTSSQGQVTIAPTRVAETTPFKPAPGPVVPAAVPAAAVPGAVAAAVPRNPVMTPAVTAALPASPAVAAAAPGIQPTPAPANAAQPAALPSDAGTNMAIDYRQGQLSLVADHAPLGKLLGLVAAKIGASIEVAPEMAQELVAAQLGPATPNEVLTALLEGPKLEYIILGSDNQGGVLKVIVRRSKNFMGQPAVAALYAPRATSSNADAWNRQAAQEQGQTAAEAPAADPTPADGTAAPQQENPPAPK